MVVVLVLLTVALFVAVGVAACYGPTRRATRLDPVSVLRCD